MYRYFKEKFQKVWCTPPEPTDPFFWTKESFDRIGLTYKATRMPVEMTLLTPQYHCVATEVRPPHTCGGAPDLDADSQQRQVPANQAAPVDEQCHGYFKGAEMMRVRADALIGFDTDAMRPSQDPGDVVERVMWRPVRIDMLALFGCRSDETHESFSQAHRRWPTQIDQHFVNLCCLAASSGLSTVEPSHSMEAREFFAGHAALYLREVARADAWERLEPFTPFGTPEHEATPDIAARMTMLAVASITSDRAAVRQKAITMYYARAWLQMYLVLNGLVALGPGGRMLFPFNTAMMRPVVELASKTSVPEVLMAPLREDELPTALRVRFRFEMQGALRCAVSSCGRFGVGQETPFGLAVSPGDRTVTLYVAWNLESTIAHGQESRARLEIDINK